MSIATALQAVFPPPELNEGEIYIGVVSNTAGELHHVVLLPVQREDINFADAKAWAASIGGDLPTRIEHLVLYKNHRAEFDQRAYWSNEEDDDPEYAGYAWFQDFSYGYQDDFLKGAALRALAVRRLVIQSFGHSNSTEPCSNEVAA